MGRGNYSIYTKTVEIFYKFDRSVDIGRSVIDSGDNMTMDISREP